jgi:phytoene dehydrogenase-like protein
LIAATRVAASGVPTVLLEKASSIGGRAATREKNAFLFNLGPHALYRHGVLRRTLQELGVEVSGALPPTNGGFVFRGGRRHTLPVGLTSLLTTGVLSLAAKFEFVRVQTLIKSVDAAAVQGETLASWLQSNVHHEEVRDLIRMLVRVSTFTNDPERQSAGAAIEQLRLALNGSVLYLNGGWQTIVDGLRRVALAAGTRIVTTSHAVALDRAERRVVDAVRLADGSSIPASAVIIAAGPEDVDALCGTRFASQLTPVRVATLDLALRSLPQPKRLVAFGADVPTYFSVHSAVARLAPEGAAMVHVSKYLRPDETADRRVEHELERLADEMQPGWQNVVEAKYFLPNLTVTHAEVTAASGGVAGRPSPPLAAFDNVFIAGDWVGSRGQLSDGAAASAADAATLATKAGLKACTTSDNVSVVQSFRAATRAS